MEVMGKKNDKFELPVCNTFRPQIVGDQLCYQVNINEFADKLDMKEASEDGLIILLDYNEELNPKIQEENVKLNILKNLKSIQNLDRDTTGATVHIKTLGNT